MYCLNCGSKIEDGSKFCQKCGAKLAEKQPVVSKNNEKPLTDIEYFAISSKRLALFSILTFGIYEIYWFYKNWQAVKKAEGQNISPFWRAIFAVFFCHSLFKKVLESAKNRGYQKSYSSGWLATAYILLLVVGNGLSKVESNDPGLNLIWLIVAVATFVPLLSVQKAINFNNEKVKGGVVSKQGFSGGEVTLIVIGVIWFLLVLIGTFSS
jgi:hypothetical protein